MSYLVLARKWRPKQLQEILGQSHVTRTLTNALASGRIAHAFLFTGARGVGKTSAARILAKALCCESSEGPTPTPCGTCNACLEIAEGRATDVFEIDAASNTGVANVREIIENVRYLPSKMRFKIYIIDEVHMLSTGAFNALLKTLEEPPAHVKFILATTDVHKVPVTILSRCQRYDFRRIPMGDVADRLSEILEEEGVDHDARALSILARESEGSMRDAQSLLEQLLAFAGGQRLDADLVRDALGIADRAVLSASFDAIASREPGKVIELIASVYDRGLDLVRFGEALLEHVRDLLVAKLVDDPKKVLDRPEDEIQDLVNRARELEAAELERTFAAMTKIVEDAGSSPIPRFTLEVGLASLAEKPPRVPLDRLVDRLKQVDLALTTRAPSGGGRERPFPAQVAQKRAAPPPAAPAPTPSTPPPAEPAPVAKAEAPAPEPTVSTPAEDPEPPLAEADPPSDAPSSGFAAFVEIVKKKRPTLSGSLAQVRPLTFGAGKVELGADNRFDEDTLGNTETKQYLEGVLETFFGQKTSLTLVRVERAQETVEESVPQTLVEVGEQKEREKKAAKEKDARERSAVKVITNSLGAKIAKVRVLDD